MVYVLLIVLFIAILPFSIKNRTAYLQEKVAKKAKKQGVEVKFDR